MGMNNFLKIGFGLSISLLSYALAIRIVNLHGIQNLLLFNVAYLLLLFACLGLDAVGRNLIRLMLTPVILLGLYLLSPPFSFVMALLFISIAGVDIGAGFATDGR